MLRLARWTAKPRVQAWFNAVCTIIWLMMLPITLSFPFFRTSILWLAFISAWALFATHLGAWIAALVNVRAESLQGHAVAAADNHQDIHVKLDHIIQHSPKMPPLPNEDSRTADQ